MKDFLAIKNIEALEVLDSRGNPTIQVEVVTERWILRSCTSSIRCINRKF
nr:MAG TPA: enolase [Caudoviricetes sp.]